MESGVVCALRSAVPLMCSILVEAFIFWSLQGLIFYLPRLFWLKQEEGRMTAISDGVRVGSVGRCDDDNEKIRNVGNNVANYIMLDQAGHFLYGFNYLLAQVGQYTGKERYYYSFLKSAQL